MIAVTGPSETYKATSGIEGYLATFELQGTQTQCRGWFVGEAACLVIGSTGRPQCTPQGKWEYRNNKGGSPHGQNRERVTTAHATFCSENGKLIGLQLIAVVPHFKMLKVDGAMSDKFARQ